MVNQTEDQEFNVGKVIDPAAGQRRRRRVAVTGVALALFSVIGVTFAALNVGTDPGSVTQVDVDAPPTVDLGRESTLVELPIRDTSSVVSTFTEEDLMTAESYDDVMAEHCSDGHCDAEHLAEMHSDAPAPQPVEGECFAESPWFEFDPCFWETVTPIYEGVYFGDRSVPDAGRGLFPSTAPGALFDVGFEQYSVSRADCGTPVWVVSDGKYHCSFDNISLRARASYVLTTTEALSESVMDRYARSFCEQIFEEPELSVVSPDSPASTFAVATEYTASCGDYIIFAHTTNSESLYQVSVTGTFTEFPPQGMESWVDWLAQRQGVSS